MENKNLIITILVGVLILGGLFLVLNQNNNTPTTQTTTNTTPAITEEASEDIEESTDETVSDDLDQNMMKKTFVVEGGNFTYSVPEIKVKQGDTVSITFVNKEGFHDLVIDEFNVKTKQLQANQEETIEFVADEAGTFEYYCSVGQHRQMGMVGNLIVE